MSSKKDNYLKSDPDLSTVLHVSVCGHANAVAITDVIFSESLSVGLAPAVSKAHAVKLRRTRQTPCSGF